MSPLAQTIVLVIEGAGLEAAVQDADKAVSQSPERVVVSEAFGALLVVEGAGDGAGARAGWLRGS